MEWLTGWNYRKKIRIKGVGGVGTGYQILLKVGESSGAFDYDFHLEGHSENFPFGKNHSGDLRFVSSDQKSLFPIWVEKVEGTAPNRTAYVWIKILSSLDNDMDIYCYYGNANADNVSNGDAVFGFFDDFDGDSLDTSKWKLYGSVSLSVSSEGLTCTAGAHTFGGIKTKFPFVSRNIAFEAKGQLHTADSITMCVTDYSPTDNPWWTKEWYRIHFQDTRYFLFQRFTDVDGGVVSLYQDNINPSIKYRVIGLLIGDTTITYSRDYVSQSIDTCQFEINDSLWLNLTVWDRGSGTYNWVRVRKYVSSEPSFYFADTEEVCPVIVFGVACDKYGRPIIGKEVKVFVFDKDNGKLLGQTLTDHYGKWECQVPVSSGTKVVTLLILEGEYYGDVDIVGAGFHVTQEMES